jgi:formamidopyrimidine-DNA glycosylase
MMPGLPDVEIYRQYLNATALHRTIITVDIKAEEMLDGITAKELKHRLIDKRFASGHRHGKDLFAQLETKSSSIDTAL